jgi:hypothetical protein
VAAPKKREGFLYATEAISEKKARYTHTVNLIIITHRIKNTARNFSKPQCAMADPLSVLFALKFNQFLEAR